MDRLRISDNGKYFVKPDGSPFIWLADTAWTVPARLKWDDVLHYMKTRKEQGFTVLQMVVLDPEYNEEMKNPCGIPALQDSDLLKPDEAYFSYVDWVLDQAEAFGFYVLLLPVWGELVVGWDWNGGTHRKIVTGENAEVYGRWLGNRMKHRPNLLWCLGGDRMPVCRGEDFRPVWRALAEGLSEGLSGRKLCYDRDHEEWKKLLFTYHACHEAETGLCSTFSYWTEEDAWISFIMLQSGHGAFKKNYELVEEERRNHPFYPVWDGEPAYEHMPMTWPVEDENSFHGTYIVRKRAYWALLSGAFGHTYGHASVWCTATQKDKNVICRETWDEAIQSEGSFQMKILRDFMEAFPLSQFVPCQQRLLRQAKQEDVLDLHEQAAENPETGMLLIYFSADTEELIDLSGLLEGDVYGSWFNPSDGTLEPIPEKLPVSGFTVSIKNTAADHLDRILILSSAPDHITIPQGTYSTGTDNTNVKKVFEW